MKKKTFIPIVIILIIVLSFIIPIKIINISSKRKEDIKVDIVINSDDPRVEESISISIKNPIINSNTTWNINSNNYYGSKIVVVFLKSDIYDIHVTVSTKDGEGSGHSVISVKNVDRKSEIMDGIPLFSILNEQVSYQNTLPIFNGTTVPKAKIIFEITSGTGRIGSEIWLSNNETLEIIESSDANIVNDQYIFEYNIDLSEYCIMVRPYNLIANLIVYEGFIRGFSHSMEIIY